MIAYITFNDQPSGVYRSQVIGVINHLNNDFKENIKLFSIISLRNFFQNRSLIRKQIPNAVVLPSFPKLSYWRWNIYLFWIINYFYSIDSFICRGGFATNLVLAVRKSNQKICYDGRGAIFAEFSEYNITPYKSILNEIFEIERKAVLLTDFRLSVSKTLIQYWIKTFQYVAGKDVVIPCTINQSQDNSEIDYRKKFGFKNEDVILVYSGSTADWQSLNLLNDWFIQILNNFTYVKILFLCKKNSTTINLGKTFPTRITQNFVNAEEVHHVLSICDYGILFREKSVTNSVAAPTKFAEYLHAGLKIIISENIGDYSDFVIRHDCGHVLSDLKSIPILKKLEYHERILALKLSNQFFSKNSTLVNRGYRVLLRNLQPNY
ncbi:MAG: hypothetical protein RIQ61_1460 [Bacteroidota bacterium]|jgi:hypothetical protein